MKAPPCFEDAEARKSIEATCRQSKIDCRLLKELCDVVMKYSGAGRADGVGFDIAECIDAFLSRTATVQKEA